MRRFDLLIITARDADQRWLFQQRLRLTDLSGVAKHSLVVADPPGPQAGSGGSTVYALCHALDVLGIPRPEGPDGEEALLRSLRGRRILLIHCGGFSQRVPPFASLGKAFAPVDRALHGTTLLEKVVESLTRLTAPLEEGVVIACGDSLYECEAPAVIPAHADALAWACPAPLDLASRHGVYVWDELTGRVLRTLQKASSAELTRAGYPERAPLDTGVLYLGPRVVAALVAPCAEGARGTWARGALRNTRLWSGLDLYRDMTHALSAQGQQAGAEHPLLDRLSRFQLAALYPESGRFSHFGTTRELRDVLTAAEPLAPAFINSLVATEARVGHGAIVNHCALGAAAHVGAGSFAMGLRAERGAAILDDHRVAYQLPVRARGVQRDAFVALGLSDDPKSTRPTLMGMPLEEWAGARDLKQEAVWGDLPASERTLWNARIFPVGSPDDLQAALAWLQDASERQAPDRDAERLSLRQIHGAFHARRWWRYETRLRARVLARELVSRMQDDPQLPAARVAASVPATLQPLVLAELERLARADRAPLQQARLWRACAEVAGTPQIDSPYHARAFSSIVRGVTRCVDQSRGVGWAHAPGTTVSAAAPARIDIAGGWTDTPPQACERGGTVVNMAITLNGDVPIRASATLLREPVLELAAHDLRRRITVTSLDELRCYTDPSDPFALHKAAFVEAGLASGASRSLPELLERLGGGLRLETDVARVPKGSGLGTSSILGTAVLGCLRELSGQDAGWRSLFHAVLRLEQRMTTGGGWQDQIGGLLPGVKLTEAGPGQAPEPEVTSIDLSAAETRRLEAHLVLFYTGLPRLAKNVLQRVVDRYLARDPETIEILAEMPRLARSTAEGIRAGDLQALGHGLARTWEWHKRLEPSSSNPGIDRLFDAAAPHLWGARLAGAGGGGFMILLARSPKDAGALRELLPRIQPSGVIYDARLAHTGLELRLERA